MNTNDNKKPKIDLQYRVAIMKSLTDETHYLSFARDIYESTTMSASPAFVQWDGGWQSVENPE